MGCKLHMLVHGDADHPPRRIITLGYLMEHVEASGCTPNAILMLTSGPCFSNDMVFRSTLGQSPKELVFSANRPGECLTLEGLRHIITKMPLQSSDLSGIKLRFSRHQDREPDDVRALWGAGDRVFMEIGP